MKVYDAPDPSKTTQNPSVLAQRILDWEIAQRKADELAATIKRAVLQLEKTQVVGNVRATYNQGRKTYDYQGAAFTQKDYDKGEFEEIVANHTEPKVAWKNVCADLGMKDVPVKSQAAPSVTLKLEG